MCRAADHGTQVEVGKPEELTDTDAAGLDASRADSESTTGCSD